MGDVAAFVQIAAKPGIDQDLPQGFDPGAAQGMGRSGGKIATGTVTSQNHRTKGTDHGKRVLQRGGVQMFRRQAVVDGDNGQPGGRADFGTDVVMALQPADHETPAMQVNDAWRGAGIDPARHPCDTLVPGRHPGGIAAEEDPAHPVIDGALFGDCQRCGVRWIGRLGEANKAPGRLVDQGGIVCHGSGLPFRGRDK